MLFKLKSFLNKNRCYCEIKISQEELNRMLKDGGILVDVRSAQEFEEGHLNNAVSLPVYDIKKKYDKILTNKMQTIIVYCSTGYRSKKAQELLKKLGYKKVYNLCNGLENAY